MACTLNEGRNIAYIQDSTDELIALPHHFYIPRSRLTDDMDDAITEFIRSDEATGLYNIFLTDRGDEHSWLFCFSDANTAFEAKLRFG